MERDGRDDLGIDLIEPSTNSGQYVFEEAVLSGEGASCHLTGHVEIGIYFPNDPHAMNLTSQVWLGYDYDVTTTGTSVAGAGLMTSRWLAFPDATNLDQSTAYDLRDPCSEPLEMNGAIEVE